MDTALSDRNLLFGILAYQNDFISREELVAAVRRWLLDKSRSVDHILVEQKRLADDERQLLEALVTVHLARHNGQVADSLAALSSIGSLRDELQLLGVPEIDATLEHVAGKRDNSDIDDTKIPSIEGQTPLTVGNTTSSGLRFRILRPHAKGGLGTVFVAEDTELNRQVALKEIQDRFAHDSDSRARFIQEAEVTGGLEHPGVVPVYGLGQYADGRPFYAMRFIHGDSLHQAADRFHAKSASTVRENRLELRDLLGRFVDVCQAMEYAHSRGVLHRDLKPGNIMLGKYGETLVVDWGLSKVVGQLDPVSNSKEQGLRPGSGSGSAPTQLGRAIGTPAYMSPEQAAGRHDELGPASDVYCLGATLFFVLTGQAPFAEMDVESCLRKVQAGEVPHPRDINHQVPKPLASVCLKAMACHPSDRYGSARELADDIERWMADEPVDAYREPPAARVARWVRRHQTVAAAAVLLTVLAALAFAGFAWQAERSRQLIALEKERADAARDRAELNFQRSLDAVEMMLTRVGDERLLDIPFLTNVRREILEDALQFYTATLSDEQDRPEVRLQTARGHRVLARCYSLLGKFDDGERHFRQSLQIMQALQDHDQPSDALVFELATTHHDLATLLRDRSQPREAAQHLQEALRLLGTMKVRSPRSEMTEANILEDQASFLHAIGDNERAFAKYSEAQLLLENLLKKNRKDPRLLRRMQAVLHNRGTVNALESRLTEAVEDLTAALQILGQLEQFDGGLPAFRADHANTLLRLGTTQQVMAEYSKAEENLNKSLEIWSQLHRTFPAVPRYQTQCAACWHHLGTVLFSRNQYERSATAFRNSISRLEDLRRESQLPPTRLADLANSYSQLAAALAESGESGESDEAESAMRSSLQLWQETAKVAPDVIRHHVMVAATHNNLAAVLRKNGKRQEAEQEFRESIRQLEALPEQVASTAPVMHDRANSWMQLASLLVDLGKAEPAEEAFVAANELFGQLTRRNSENPKYLVQHAASFHNFAVFQYQRSRRAEALENVSHSIDLLERGVERFEKHPVIRRDLASSWFMLGQLREADHRPEEARDAFAKSERIWSELNEQHQGVPDLQNGLDVVHARQRLLDGQLESAAEIAQTLATRHGGRQSDAYNAACIFAWCLDRVPVEESDSTRALATRLRTSAMQQLQHLAATGGVTASQLLTDVDLAALRTHAPFQQLIRELQSRAKADE